MDGKKKKSSFQARYLQFTIMCLCNTVMFIMRSSLGVAILAMTDKTKDNGMVEIYDWDETMRGVILSSFFWGYTIMQIPIGVLSKRYGGKPPFLAALIINGVLCLLTPSLARVGGWIAMCIVRGCMGLTQSCFKPSNHTLLGKWTPPNQKNRIAMFVYAGMSVGTIIAMPFCGLLSSTYLGWQLIFYAMGILSLITSVIYWMFAASTPAEHRFIKEDEKIFLERAIGASSKELDEIPWKCIITSVPLYALILAHVGWNWCWTLFISELPAYLNQGLNMSIQKGSTLAALPFIAYWLMTFISSFIADLINNKNIFNASLSRKLFQSIASFGVALGLIIITFLDASHKALIIVIVTITVGALGCSSCGYMLTHIDMAPNYCGVLYAITNFVANFCGILTPISAGYILGDQSSNLVRWKIVFYIAAAIVSISNIVFIIFGNAERQTWDINNAYTKDTGELLLSKKGPTSVICTTSIILQEYKLEKDKNNA